MHYMVFFYQHFYLQSIQLPHFTYKSIIRVIKTYKNNKKYILAVHQTLGEY